MLQIKLIFPKDALGLARGLVLETEGHEEKRNQMFCGLIFRTDLPS